jgi:hypothetical protein
VITNYKDARAAFEPSRPLQLVHSVTATETDCERLTREVREMQQRVHRALERKLQAASDYEAAVLARDRKAQALELTIRVLGRRDGR